jgi:tRNA pseudouridine38-40 synthase
MVRAIVGTLIEIGENKYEIDHIEKVIKSKNRELAGYSVPAHGLYLTNIIYPDFKL